MLKEVVRLTNRRIRLLVGLLVAGLFCVQCTRTDADPQSHLATIIHGVKVGENSEVVSETVDRLARTDHIALLNYCLKNYQGRYRDYTCTFVKQERVHGVLGNEQTTNVKFLDQPYSVVMTWTQNAPIGDKVLYVEGKYNNQMLVRPKGILRNLVGTVMRKPDSPEAMNSTLRPVSMFGFERSIESLLDVYRQAKEHGDLKEAFGGYGKVEGRDVVIMARYLPPKGDYPAHVTRVYLDVEYLVPVIVEGVDWDGKAVCRYLYKDLKFNVGLTPDDFRPEAVDMALPK